MKDWGEGDGLTSIDKMVGPGQVKGERKQVVVYLNLVHILY